MAALAGWGVVIATGDWFGHHPVVRGLVQGLLDQLAPYPAVVMTPWFEQVAYNAPFRFMIDDMESIPETDRNCAYLNFTHPDWLAGHVDHERECAAIVAALRAGQR